MDSPWYPYLPNMETRHRECRCLFSPVLLGLDSSLQVNVSRAGDPPGLSSPCVKIQRTIEWPARSHAQPETNHGLSGTTST